MHRSDSARTAGRTTAGQTTVRGRGAVANPKNRFDIIEVVSEEPAPDRLPTRYLRDASKSIISSNDSPDVPFDLSLNPYRGCEHGCIYCYARPSHEYLGFSAGLDFESRIVVKEEAPRLLRAELSSPSWRPRVLAMSGITDPYQPIERRLGITRQCLQQLAATRHPVAIITKNELVTRDIDLLASLAQYNAATVAISLTTLDGDLARIMEPRASHPKRRLAAIRALGEAGIPTCVLVSPVIPGITDHEIPQLLSAAAEAGATTAGCLVLRLPGAVAKLFEAWLEAHFPERRSKVMNKVRQVQGDNLLDPRFGHRMRGNGPLAEQIRGLFKLAAKKAGLGERGPNLSATSFRPPNEQLRLF